MRFSKNGRGKRAKRGDCYNPAAQKKMKKKQAKRSSVGGDIERVQMVGVERVKSGRGGWKNRDQVSQCLQKIGEGIMKTGGVGRCFRQWLGGLDGKGRKRPWSFPRD